MNPSPPPPKAVWWYCNDIHILREEYESKESKRMTRCFFFLGRNWKTRRRYYYCWCCCCCSSFGHLYFKTIVSQKIEIAGEVAASTQQTLFSECKQDFFFNKWAYNEYKQQPLRFHLFIYETVGQSITERSFLLLFSDILWLYKPLVIIHGTTPPLIAEVMNIFLACILRLLCEQIW